MWTTCSGQELVRGLFAYQKLYDDSIGQRAIQPDAIWESHHPVISVRIRIFRMLFKSSGLDRMENQKISRRRFKKTSRGGLRIEGVNINTLENCDSNSSPKKKIADCLTDKMEDQ